ncbi:MAG: cytochrome c oxidase subunit [Solirubrobacteraceae bacterium]|nr:cytochrome c oxidase subunit [Solirubrobacteraceae bacterium]
MRAAPALLALLVLAACGGGDAERRSQRAPASDPGLKVWTAQGCGSCHTFAPAGATATIGPNLGLSLGGRSRAYIRQSIVAPNARVPGGGRSIMPEGFGQALSKAQLDALVAFIARGVRAR